MAGRFNGVDDRNVDKKTSETRRKNSRLCEETEKKCICCGEVVRMMGEKMFRNISKHVVFFSLYTRKLHASYISLNN